MIIDIYRYCKNIFDTSKKAEFKSAELKSAAKLPVDPQREFLNVISLTFALVWAWYGHMMP
jgi:hypothetical protein